MRALWLALAAGPLSAQNAGWVFQYAFSDNLCGAQGFSSSDGLLFAIQ
jgi:hypothetical protein